MASNYTIHPPPIAAWCGANSPVQRIPEFPSLNQNKRPKEEQNSVIFLNHRQIHFVSFVFRMYHYMTSYLSVGIRRGCLSDGLLAY